MQKGVDEIYIRLKKSMQWIKNIKKASAQLKKDLIIINNQLKMAELLSGKGKQLIIDEVVILIDKIVEE